MGKVTRDGIYKRGRVWWLRTDPITGRARSTGCHDFAAAKAYQVARRQLTRDPQNAAAEQAELGEWVLKTIALKQKTKSTATVEIYEKRLGHFARLFGDQCRLADVTPGAVDRFVAARRAERVTDHTIIGEIVCLVQLLKYARRSGCYRGDIAALKPLELTTGYKPRSRNLSMAEVNALMSELSPDRAAFVALTVGLGLRRSEAFGLRADDVRETSVLVRGTKTPGSYREVPILSPFRELVAFGVKALPIRLRLNVRRELRAACKRAGVAPCSPNDLRRTFATICLSLGIDRDVVRRMMGHTSSAMVDRVYGRPSADALSELAESQLTRQLRDSAEPPRLKQASAPVAQWIEQGFPKAFTGAASEHVDGFSRTNPNGDERASTADATKSLQPETWSLALAAESVGLGRVRVGREHFAVVVRRRKGRVA